MITHLMFLQVHATELAEGLPIWYSCGLIKFRPIHWMDAWGSNGRIQYAG